MPAEYNPNLILPTAPCKYISDSDKSNLYFSLTNNDGTAANASACSVYDNSISLFGMSKSFAMPGLRLGWLCTRNKRLYDMMSSFKDYLTICPPAPSEVLALIALRCRTAVLKHTMDIIHKNLKELAAFFGRHSDVFEWHPPRASTIGFVRLKGWLLRVGTGGASGFCEALVQQKEVLFLPATMYDFADEYVRVGFGRRNLSECLVPLEEFLSENRNRYE